MQNFNPPIHNYVLWGFHRLYLGPDGSMQPLRITAGSLAWCKVEQSYRSRQGGWTMAIYRAGDAPTGLRAQCEAALSAGKG